MIFGDGVLLRLGGWCGRPRKPRLVDDDHADNGLLPAAAAATLPDEVLAAVLSRLDCLRDVLQADAVCRRWRDAHAPLQGRVRLLCSGSRLRSQRRWLHSNADRLQYLDLDMSPRAPLSSSRARAAAIVCRRRKPLPDERLPTNPHALRLLAALGQRAAALTSLHLCGGGLTLGAAPASTFAGAALTQLSELTISSSGAATLPESLGRLPALQRLALLNCSHLRQLPSTITDAAGLRELVIVGCSRLSDLHQGLPVGLTRLVLTGCSELQTLPDDVCQLGLQELLLSCCPLRTLPAAFPGPLLAHSLLCLEIVGCTQLQVLPEGLSRLSSLRSLRLTLSTAVDPPRLAALTGLHTLSLLGGGATSAAAAAAAASGALPFPAGGTVPDPADGQHLALQLQLQLDGNVGAGAQDQQHAGATAAATAAAAGGGGGVDDSWWWGAHPAQDALDCLLPSGLARLELAGWPQLSVLPPKLASGRLPALRELSLRDCGALSALPDGLGASLTRLTSLHVSGCGGLVALSDRLPAGLVLLLLLDCDHLRELPQGLGQLLSLQELVVARCPRLRHLPDSLGRLGAASGQLRTVTLCGLDALEELPVSMHSIKHCITPGHRAEAAAAAATCLDWHRHHSSAAAATVTATAPATSSTSAVLATTAAAAAAAAAAASKAEMSGRCCCWGSGSSGSSSRVYRCCSRSQNCGCGGCRDDAAPGGDPATAAAVA